MPMFTVPRLFFFGVIALVLALEARAQSSAPLDLTLSVAATEVPLAGALSLALVFRNGDTQQLLVLRGQPAFEEGGGLQLTVTDAGGARRLVAMQSVGADLPNPAVAERIQVLPPGHGISVHRRMQTTALFPAAGRYRLEVSYTPPNNPPAALPVGSINATAAVSGQVEVEVTQ